MKLSIRDLKLISQLSRQYKEEFINAFKDEMCEVVNGREQLRTDRDLHDMIVFFGEWLELTEEEYIAPEVEDYTGVTNEDR
jgi:hypothetical protein